MSKTNERIIHEWASQNVDYHSNRCNNVSFSGKLLYSYNTVIAQIETDKNGQLWAFLSSESITPTTSKHVNYSWRATTHMTQVLTPAFSVWSGQERTIKELLLPLYEELKNDFTALHRKRSNLKWSMARYNERKQSLYNAIASFKVKCIKKDLPETDGNLKEKALLLNAKAEKARKAKLVKQKRERRQKEKEQLEQFETWLTTGQGAFPSSYGNSNYSEGAFLTIKNNEVITSRHASAPLDHVKKALIFYDTRKQADGSFKEWKTNVRTIALGHFKLDQIDIEGNVKAGCHLFKASEIARFRKQWRL